MSEFQERLLDSVSPYLTLSKEQVEALEDHYELLVRWNARLNLTAVRTLEEAVRVHYGECLYFSKVVRERWPDVVRVADVGSGAGFPGIPLAVFWPECSVTLIESHRRKAVFLRESTSRLPNVSVMAGRAEEDVVRYDLVVSRAVTPGDVLELKLARRTALLVASGDVPRGTESVTLPWASGRCVMFHVEQDAT
jgi:16S rRNA (guanine527-N7)-methyltransferase